MQNDPYSEVMAEYGGWPDGTLLLISWKANWTGDLEDEQALNEIIRKQERTHASRKELEESDKIRKRMYERIVNYDQEGKTEKAAANPSGHPSADSLMQKGPIYHAENGKRVRRQPTSAPGNKQPLQGLHPRRPDRSHGQYGTDAVASGRNPIRHEDTGQHAVLRYRHFGSQPPRCGSQQPEGRRQPHPVSVVVFDNDAMEGLNLPNNLKASAAKRMEQGLVQNIDMPLSSIGTMASEVTSVVNATTQVAKQI